MNIADSKKRSLADHLRQGEQYAGLVLGKDGQPDYHLILLAGQVEDVSWQKATAWAKAQGGELPTSREQSLLFANLPEEFDKRAYWSSQTEGDAYAWYQSFGGGYQSYGREGSEFRARAVRRLPI